MRCDVIQEEWQDAAQWYISNVRLDDYDIMTVSYMCILSAITFWNIGRYDTALGACELYEEGYKIFKKNNLINTSTNIQYFLIETFNDVNRNKIKDIKQRILNKVIYKDSL